VIILYSVFTLFKKKKFHEDCIACQEFQPLELIGFESMLQPGLFYFGFLVPDCTKKNLAKEGYKKCQKNWMKSPNNFEIKKYIR